MMVEGSTNTLPAAVMVSVVFTASLLAVRGYVASTTIPERGRRLGVTSIWPGGLCVDIQVRRTRHEKDAGRIGREGRWIMNVPTPAPRTSSPPSHAPVSPPPVLTRRGELTTRSVWWFFAATFAVTWGLGILVIAFMDEIESIFGPMGYTNPVFVLMVYSPGFVALAVVWRHHGTRGLVAFLRRLTLWRMSLGWWLLLLLGMPAVFYAGAAVNGTATDFPFDPWYGVLPALIPALFIGPIEELGWRGVALPLLQRRFAPLWSALIVGAVAAIWHTPAFLMSGTKQSAWSFWPFFFGVVAISVILTPMFNAAGGSLLVAALFHAQMNGPAWPDAQPWDMLGFVLVAIAVVVVKRRSMLTRGAGTTDLLLPDVAAVERATVRS